MQSNYETSNITPKSHYFAITTKRKTKIKIITTLITKIIIIIIILRRMIITIS